MNGATVVYVCVCVCVWLWLTRQQMLSSTSNESADSGLGFASLEDHTRRGAMKYARASERRRPAINHCICTCTSAACGQIVATVRTLAHLWFSATTDTTKEVRPHCWGGVSE